MEVWALEGFGVAHILQEYSRYSQRKGEVTWTKREVTWTKRNEVRRRTKIRLFASTFRGAHSRLTRTKIHMSPYTSFKDSDVEKELIVCTSVVKEENLFFIFLAQSIAGWAGSMAL